MDFLTTTTACKRTKQSFKIMAPRGHQEERQSGTLMDKEAN